MAIRPSAANVALIEVWMAHEGGLWANNPLNTSLGAARYPHQVASTGSDTGIPIYPNLRVGIEETATTLLGNRAYAGILVALERRSASCVAFAAAVIDSPWAASHYGRDTSRFCPGSGRPRPAGGRRPAPVPGLRVHHPGRGHRGRFAGQGATGR